MICNFSVRPRFPKQLKTTDLKIEETADLQFQPNDHSFQANRDVIYFQFLIISRLSVKPSYKSMLPT